MAGAPAPAAPRVLVTRPQPQADDWVAQLAARGIAAVAVPLLGIAPPQRPEAVIAAWQAMPTRTLVMFVSPSAVERFFALRPAGVAWPSATWAGSTGPGTAQALREAGVPAAAIVTPPADAPHFDTEALWRELAPRRDWAGAQVSIVRGEDGRDWLADTLRAQGAQVGFVEAYRRIAPALDDAARQALAAARAAPAQHLWLFSSSEGARQLTALAPGADWSAARALATHPRIAQAARGLGFGHVDEVAPSPDAVAAWITRSIQSP